MEIWRDIPSLPEYQASSFGRIQRIPYEAPMPRGGTRVYGGKPWSGTSTTDEPRLVFQFRGKTYKVAKVVCEAFHGPKPFPQAVAMHRNENIKDNRPGNLCWGTQKQTLNKPSFIAYCWSRVGVRSPTAIHRRRAAEAEVSS